MGYKLAAVLRYEVYTTTTDQKNQGPIMFALPEALICQHTPPAFASVGSVCNTAHDLTE